MPQVQIRQPPTGHQRPCTYEPAARQTQAAEGRAGARHDQRHARGALGFCANLGDGRPDAQLLQAVVGGAQDAEAWKGGGRVEALQIIAAHVKGAKRRRRQRRQGLVRQAVVSCLSPSFFV